MPRHRNASVTRILFYVVALAVIPATLPSMGAPSYQHGAAGAHASPARLTPHERHAVWEAVLDVLRQEHGPTEGDFTRVAGALMGRRTKAKSATAEGLTLYWPPDAHHGPGDEAWSEAVARRGLVREVCRVPLMRDCRDTVLTTYVSLGVPEQVSPDTISVEEDETALNPVQCRTSQAVVGGWQRTWLLVKRDAWRVTGTNGRESSSSGFCITPTLEALMRRDSLFRTVPSPLAGTYRFVITLADHDSVVLYSRTERYPMSVLHARTLDEIGKALRPIRGYDLMAVCALRPRDLPERYDGGRPMEACYHTVGVPAIFASPERQLFRGTPEVVLSAWLLLQDTPIASALVPLLKDSLRDSANFFTPGIWQLSRNGEATFSWIIHAGDSVLAVVRGHRISLATLSSRTE